VNRYRLLLCSLLLLHAGLLADSASHDVALTSRAYLNQLALPDGEEMCSSTSLAMVLAMVGVVEPDHAAMAAAAEAIFPRVQRDGQAYIGMMLYELLRQGVRAELHADIPADEGWQIIRSQVDAGQPVIVRTSPGVLTLAGHFLVVVGYRSGFSRREVIAYDPFGRWHEVPCHLLPGACAGNYDRNTADPSSAKGQGVVYHFDEVFGRSNYLISVQGRGTDGGGT